MSKDQWSKVSMKVNGKQVNTKSIKYMREDVDDFIEQIFKTRKWYKIKWYAFIPIIGYALWFGEAKTTTQLLIVFLYQLFICFVGLFLSVQFNLKF
jgi:hypothetical protein